MEKKIEVKTDKTLSKLLQQICEVDIDMLTTMCSRDSDAYTWGSGSTDTYDEGLKSGMRLATLSLKLEKPIYEVQCEIGLSVFATLHFVASKKEVEALLKKRLAEAKKDLGLQE